jgi:SAM-dependent methyltransferase
MKNIDVVYTGKTAEKYDPSRGGSTRWKREADVIVPMLRSIPRGASLIDIAAGTGRWLPIYGELGLSPVLIDSSNDMLKQAVQKAAALGLDIRTVCGSALSPDPFPSAQFAVVTNFFNWISLRDVEAVIQKVIAAGVSRILFMISFFPTGGGLMHTIRKNISFGYRNFRSRIGWREKGHYFLHPERDVRAMFRRLGLSINAENLVATHRYKQNVMIDATIPPLPAITFIDRCVVRGDTCEIDGKIHPLHRGRWACYVPDLGFKFLYGIGEQLHCTHSSAPDRAALFAGQASISGSSYTAADWLTTYSKKVTRRAAENYVAASRLASMGIGPAVRGCLAVREFIFDERIAPGMSAGVCIDNLEAYAEKRKTTEREMVNAGVAPDRTRSSLRQQIRGYVSDLNSVVGVMPVNAAGEISRLETALDNALLSAE